MDFRVVDTPLIITTRNLIRVSALTNLFLVAIYLSIEPYFDGAHVSWIHQFHVILQPLILFVSLADSTIISRMAAYMAIIPCVFDAGITWLNYIAIYRCFAEPTATCLDVAWEKGVWFVLGFSFFITDLFSFLRLSSLESMMVKKDKLERQARIEFQEDDTKEDPDLIRLQVNFAKLRNMHIFLIPSGCIYIFTTIGQAMSNWFYWLTMGHLFVDLYGASVSTVHTKISLYIMIGMLALFATMNIVGLVWRITEGTQSLAAEIAYLISMLYIFGDAVLVYYGVDCLRKIDKYGKIKSS